RGDLERHLAGVDLVVAAVGEADLDVDHRVPREDAGLRRLLHALLHRRHVLAGDGGALQPVLEDEPSADLPRLDLEPDVTVLAPAARLPHEAALGLGLLANRLPVRYLWLADVGLDLELAQEPVDDDLEVQLAHPVDERLVRLGIDVDLESRILEGEAGEGEP